ncbi:MAG: LysM peptidoglycan-binding domain-containing M23 family metallopeptidase [Candidatus Omnitrophica bacterium]|nr:LysM peptidoglycan-binding domain-containing M23 family metallopeptidase [Candidatus Omnitrophota bacterium]
MRHYPVFSIITLYLIINIFGCASPSYIAPSIAPLPKISGTYHRVEKGQTLWQISRMYNVELEEIVSINRIQGSSHIESGQLIFIPSQKRPAVTKGYSYRDSFIWPVKGMVIATFGQNFRNMINKGINIKPERNLEVIASQNGKVVFCSDDFGPFGKTIIIEHENGFSTVYARNSRLMVKAGDIVQKGAVIAIAGSNDKDKEVYLHFEIRKGSVPQNPYYYLP